VAEVGGEGGSSISGSLLSPMSHKFWARFWRARSRTASIAASASKDDEIACR
jgi:hypothetical protein